jgi:murein L,D-transpeptidase YcbB/YkuD
MLNRGAPRRLFPAQGILVLLMAALLGMQSCAVKRGTTKKTTEVSLPSRVLAPKTEGLNLEQEFISVLKNSSAVLPYPQWIQAAYQKKNYEPVLLSKLMEGKGPALLLDYLMAAADHGLDPRLFSANELRKQLETYTKTGAPDAESYRKTMELELRVAAALIRYSVAMQFGVSNPAKVYALYSTATRRPDSIYILRVFDMKQLKNYLDSLQPTAKQYLALQRTLKTEQLEQGKSAESICRNLALNMERLRWQNKPAAQKYVRVNIAGFGLDVIENGKSVLNMKVCVGESGEKATPQLSSMVHSVQVNPVWNIPLSIAIAETTRHAAEDRYYLANNNINVYRKGKLVSDPESIDWTVEDPGSYTFKQQPGVKNALGKIKFLFKNQSSVYLHDTPVQKPFNKWYRAISHGCVRVEKPLDLAFALFADGKKYQQVKSAMDSGYPRAKYIGLPRQVPIWITYYTAWADVNGVIHFYNDVYGLDRQLDSYLQKINEGKTTVDL